MIDGPQFAVWGAMLVSVFLMLALLYRRLMASLDRMERKLDVMHVLLYRRLGVEPTWIEVPRAAEPSARDRWPNPVLDHARGGTVSR